MKRSVLVLVAFVLVVAVTGFWLIRGRSGDSATPTSSAQAAQTAKPADTGKICVAQYVSHPLLDAVYAGFREELVRQQFPSTEIHYENANGDATAASLLADKVSKQQCALIFVLATPMAQSVKSACPPTQPILFGAITDPITAGLVTSMETPGGNITGTSDQWPYDLQMQLIANVWGDRARVGVPFNPAEANTQFAMDRIRKSAKRIGLSLHEVPINSMIEASQAVDALAKRVDVIYVPADNTAVAAAPGIVAAADRASLPVVAGDPGTFKAGAVLGIGVDYSNLGVLNAKQALSILAGSSPSSMPVQTSSRPEFYANAERAARFKVDLVAARKWYEGAIR